MIILMIFQIGTDYSTSTDKLLYKSIVDMNKVYEIYYDIKYKFYSPQYPIYGRVIDFNGKLLKKLNWSNYD